jgi:putative lipoic acid-binding regulatory protein
MADKQRPEDLLEFPCQYQFKALGMAGEVFAEAILRAIRQHAAVASDSICSRPSSKGSYQSVSVLVTLHSFQQLENIYAEMRKVPELKMLL